MAKTIKKHLHMQQTVEEYLRHEHVRNAVNKLPEFMLDVEYEFKQIALQQRMLSVVVIVLMLIIIALLLWIKTLIGGGI